MSHGRVVERACRCLRFGVRCVGAGCSALLPALCGALPALYDAHPHGCVLYVCGVLCDVTARRPHAAPHLLQLLHALLPPALALLQAHNGLQDNPDTVDDLFRLCIRSGLCIVVLCFVIGSAILNSISDVNI